MDLARAAGRSVRPLRGLSLPAMSVRPPLARSARAPLSVVLVSLAAAALAGGCRDATPAAPSGGNVETVWYDPNTRTLKQEEGVVRFGLRLGEWTFWHRNQAVAKKGRYDDQGRETGEWIEYHPSQSEKSRVTYVAGKLEGPSQEWHPQGALKAKGAYAGGARVGLWETFHENGAPDSRATYVQGVLDGEALGWYPDGTERERARFKRGVLVGVVEAFHPTGAPRARKVLDDNGKPIDDNQEWFQSGQLKAIKRFGANGLEQGLEESYHESGALASLRSYSNGKLVGMGRGWHDNGKLAYEGAYVDGQRDGIWRSYYADGKRQTIENFAAGKRRGVSRNWLPDGRMNAVAYFEDDVPMGLFQQWFLNGNRRTYSHVAGERIEGLSLEWTEDGALVEETSGFYVAGARSRALDAGELELAAALALDLEPRPLPADLYDPLPEVEALEAQPMPLPVLPTANPTRESDR